MNACLIGGGAGCLLLILLAVGGWFWFLHWLRAGEAPRPAQDRSAGVVLGAGLLTRSTFISDPRLGDITDLAWGILEPPAGPELGLASSTGVAIVAGGVVQSFTPLAGADRVTILVHSGAACEYMNRGSWGRQAGLFDHAGRRLWKYTGPDGVDDMAAGDLYGDGSLEFVVGFNGGGGVHLLNNRGVKQWDEPDGNVWHVEIADVNGDGRGEIIHSNAEGEMILRDAQGHVLSRGKPPSYFSDFCLAYWGPDRRAIYPVYEDDNEIRVLGYDAKPLARMAAPGAGSLGSAHAAPVRLRAGQPDYFAVVVDYGRGRDLAILYVYDGTQKLVYQEILDSPCATLGVVPGNPGEETLLVGTKGRVFQYVMSGGV
jgi:hypothetical protein